MIPRPQAAPTPVLRSRNTRCTHGIPLDVSQNGQQMFVALHREALESSLIKMSVTHGPMRDPPAHCMRVRQPTEESRDLAVCLRPDNKVPMVRQDTVGQDADRVSLVRLDHDPLKRLEVGVLGKEVLLPTDRFKTWYTCPPGAFRAALGMRRKLTRKHWPLSILAVSLFPSLDRVPVCDAYNLAFEVAGVAQEDAGEDECEHRGSSYLFRERCLWRV